MIFFIYSSLLFNKGLAKEKDYDLISMLFYISMTALTAFSIFFINYAHSAFIKLRNKEFGVYLTLGMNSMDLQRIVTIENLIIILSALATGIFSGMLFSRLFQMIVLKLLNITKVSYSLDYRSFALTAGVFSLIFTSVIIFSSFKTKKLDISDLLKEPLKKEGKNCSIIPGLIGIGIMMLSMIMLFIITKSQRLRSESFIIVAYIILSFIGAYMIISYVGAAFMTLIKNRDYYFNNVLAITEINHKFNQNKKIIFILSILSSMTITLVASPFSLYNLSASIAEMSQPNHIEFFQLGRINKLSKDELNSIIEKNNLKLEKISGGECISLHYDGPYDKYDVMESKPIISQDTYNSITGERISLKRGEAYNVITAWEPGYHGIKPQSTITFSHGPKTFSFNIKDSKQTKWIVNIEAYKSSSGIVLCNEDFSYIKNNISSESLGIIQGINFNSWKNTGVVVERLADELNKRNKSLSNDEQKLASYLGVASIIKAYENSKRQYSLFIFVTTIMGILFFVAGGSVLFFKQYTELNNDKIRFQKLYKIGISEKEAAAVIAKELRITFFTPLIIGNFLGYSFIYLLTCLFGGAELLKEFIINATYVVIAYFLFQAVFYNITKRKYTSEILK